MRMIKGITTEHGGDAVTDYPSFAVLVHRQSADRSHTLERRIHDLMHPQNAELFVGPLLVSLIEELETWREDDCKRQDNDAPESAAHMMRGMQLTMNVGYAATTTSVEFSEQLNLVHQQMLCELRNLRETFAPGEEIRASAARLRGQQRYLTPRVAEHEMIASEAGLLYEELATRYRAAVFPVRGKTVQYN
jgi:hypothetical protein